MWIDVVKSFTYIMAELTLLFFGISFLISLLQGLIPYDKVEKYLFSKNALIGSVFAVIFAFITPFCSCSTIPIVANMLQRGIRFGIVMIFLFASPVLDPTILSLMSVMLGWKVTVIYTVSTTVMCIVIGFTLEKLNFKRYVKVVVVSDYTEFQGQRGLNVRSAWKETMSLMKRVYPYLVIGAAIGSLIHGLIPTDLISKYFGNNNWWLVPIAAIIGIPLYIRLSTMIPISQIMIAKGMAVGPVMALMISSVGASLPEVTLLHSIFQRKLVLAFVFSVITMSTMAGTIFYLI